MEGKVIDPKSGLPIDNTPKCPFVAVPVQTQAGVGFMGTMAFCISCIFHDVEKKQCKLLLLCDAVLNPRLEVK